MSDRVELAVLIVNHLAVTRAHGREVTPREGWFAAIGEARPVEGLRPEDADRLAEAARGLRALFGAGAAPEVAGLNALLIRHAAVPNLHSAPGERPTLAFHLHGADTVDAWIADAATALAMIIGVGQGARLGRCQAAVCDLVFLDATRNASRRFCGLACQNRAKASTYRARRLRSTL